MLRRPVCKSINKFSQLMLSFGGSFFASEVKHYAKYVLDIVYLVIKMRSFRKFYDITMPGR